MAEKIQKKVNWDMYEIIPTREYDDDMWKCWDEAQGERANNDYPELVNKLPNIADYDVILVGWWVRWYTLANPTYSFMHKMDFWWKKVSAFWTFYDHDEEYNKDMKEYTINWEYIDWLPLPRTLMADEENLNNAINEWIKNF